MRCLHRGSPPGPSRKPPRWPPGFCPCPHHLPHPGARVILQVSVNPVLPLLKTLPWLSPTQSNGWHPLTACVTSHSLTPVNSQDSPPPSQAPSAPVTPGTSLFLKHCKRAPASGPLHLLLPLPGRLLSRYPLGSLPPLLQFLGQRSPP